MNRVVASTLFALLLAVQGAWAQTIDGETFTQKFVGNPPNGDKLVEFVREGESFEQWTKLIGYRLQHAPQIDNDPEKMVLAMAKVLKQRNPQAIPVASRNKETGEAVLDFVTWAADGRFIEFNVFRFFKSAEGDALVSVQLAHRSPKSELGEELGKKLAEMRKSWLRQALSVDKTDVERVLTEQAIAQ